MKRIAAVGVYALKNPGSVLIGHVLKTELERRVPDSRVDLFSLADRPLWVFDDPWDCTATRREGYEMIPFLSAESDRLVERILAEYDAVVLGGDTIWSPHNPWPDLFWLDDDALQSASLPIASHAACLREPFHFLFDDKGIDYWRRRAGRLCDRLDYISVRDLRTRQNFEDLGVEREIHVVNEPVLLWERRESQQVRELLEATGLDRSRPIVGVTVSKEIAGLRSNARDELIDGLYHLRDKHDCQILLFPYSEIHHQQQGMELLRRELEGEVFALDRLLDPWGSYDLIGELALFIAFPGYHALIAALSQRVPVLTLDIYTSRPCKNLKSERYIMGPCTKILQLIQSFNLEESYVNPYVDLPRGMLRSRLELLLTSRRDTSARLARIQQGIRDHFDRLARVVG